MIFVLLWGKLYIFITIVIFIHSILPPAIQNGKLQDANIIFNQGLPKIFGVPKYAAVLTDICKSRDITVNVNHNLVEVRHDKKEAIFKLMDKETPEYVTYQVSLCKVHLFCKLFF